MRRDEREMEKLERTGAMQILIFLYRWSQKEKKQARMKDILEGVHAHPETVERSAALLVELGFVEDEKSPKFPYEHTFWLTEAGATLAKHLTAADDVMRGYEL